MTSERSMGLSQPPELVTTRSTGWRRRVNRKISLTTHRITRCGPGPTPGRDAGPPLSPAAGQQMPCGPVIRHTHKAQSRGTDSVQTLEYSDADCGAFINKSEPRTRITLPAEAARWKMDAWRQSRRYGGKTQRTGTRVTHDANTRIDGNNWRPRDGNDSATYKRF